MHIYTYCDIGTLSRCWKDTMVPASGVFWFTSNMNCTAPTGQGKSLPCRQSCCESRGALNMLNSRSFVLLTFENTDSVGFRLQTGSNAPHSNYALDPQTWPIISQYFYIFFVFEKWSWRLFIHFVLLLSFGNVWNIYIYMFCGATWFPLPSRYDLFLPWPWKLWQEGIKLAPSLDGQRAEK